MNPHTPHRRALLTRAFWLVLPLLALAWMVQSSDADTLRAELYEFDAQGSVSQSDAAIPHVYMRVSNADGLISYLARPWESSSAKGNDRFALFEFFLGSESSSCSLSRVRFRNFNGLQNPLGRLRTVCSSEQAGPLVAPDAGFVSGDFTANLPGDGVSSGEVAGLLFELAPTESIHSLLDDRLAGGDLRPEVEVCLGHGPTVWLSGVRLVTLRPCSLPKEYSLDFATASSAVLNVSPTQRAVAGTSLAVPAQQAAIRFFREADAKFVAFVFFGMRAREPPMDR